MMLRTTRRINQVPTRPRTQPDKMMSTRKTIALLYDPEQVRHLRQTAGLYPNLYVGATEADIHRSIRKHLEENTWPSAPELLAPPSRQEMRTRWEQSHPISAQIRRAFADAQQHFDSAHGAEVLRCLGQPLLPFKGDDAQIYHLAHFIELAEMVAWMIRTHAPARFVLFGGVRDGLMSPERPTVEFLTGRQDWYPYIVQRVAEARGVVVEHRHQTRLAPVAARRNMRELAILGAKQSRLARSTAAVHVHNMALNRGRKAAAVDDKPVALFVVRGASEWYTLKALFEQIRADGKLSPRVVIDEPFKEPTAEAVMKQSGEAYIFLHRFVRPAGLLSMARTTAQVFRCGRSLSGWSPPPAVLEASETDRLILEDPRIMRETVRAQLQAMPEIALFMEAFHALLAEMKPAIVFSATMIEAWGPALRVACDRRGVPLLAIQNASLGRWNLPWLCFAHRFLVSSKWTKDWMQQCGVKEESLGLAGLPLYDLALNAASRREQIREEMGIRPNEHLILITTQAFNSDLDRRVKNRELIDFCLQATAGAQDTRVLLKLHPREHRRDYADVEAKLATWDGRVEIADAADVVPLLAAADLLVSRSSTTVGSALIAGCPVVIIKDDQVHGGEVEYLSTEAVEYISNAEELKVIVEKMRAGPAFRQAFQERRRDYLDQIIGPALENATQKITSIAYQMAEDADRLTGDRQ